MLKLRRLQKKNEISEKVTKSKLMHENSVSIFTVSLYLWGQCPIENALYWT